MGLFERAGSKSRSRSKDRTTLPPLVTADPIKSARSKSRSRSNSSTIRNPTISANPSAYKRRLESGTLLASSVKGSHPSLDYALIKIEGSHTSMSEQLLYNNGAHDLTLNVTQVSDSRPNDAKIVAITGSSGYLSGRLLATRLFLERQTSRLKKYGQSSLMGNSRKEIVVHAFSMHKQVIFTAML
ncbi:uncharacterized protein BHQ10_004430 [Talaromyces amestolkiae]|uniref:Uncharacterized protein n=1 Tax=Talaromyces amestolkiae TaxID=1196081 RepID=A0A364KXZ2_TALAM|nr:uncharacterized protein BHQ10_004430 [Talaromyces amestolkiae]RAO68418.1 hypothetical protein BHQ10_004430 [Talaromyces amestolkiae]